MGGAPGGRGRRRAAESPVSLSFAQLEGLWIRNGGSPALAPVMAAIAIAESEGDPNSLNDNATTGDYSVGLWQINYFGGLMQSRTAAYGSPAQLQQNPDAQARAAIDLAGNGQGLGNWSTYSSGVYRQFLQAVPPDNTTPVSTAAAATTTPTASGGNYWSSAQANNNCAWKIPRIGFGVAGGLGPYCVADWSRVHALVGGLLLGAAGLIGAFGLVLLLRTSGVQRVAAPLAAGVRTASGGRLA